MSARGTPTSARGTIGSARATTASSTTATASGALPKPSVPTPRTTTTTAATHATPRAAASSVTPRNTAHTTTVTRTALPSRTTTTPSSSAATTSETQQSARSSASRQTPRTTTATATGTTTSVASGSLNSARRTGAAAAVASRAVPTRTVTPTPTTTTAASTTASAAPAASAASIANRPRVSSIPAPRATTARGSLRTASVSDATPAAEANLVEDPVSVVPVDTQPQSEKNSNDTTTSTPRDRPASPQPTASDSSEPRDQGANKSNIPSAVSASEPAPVPEVEHSHTNHGDDNSTTNQGSEPQATAEPEPTPEQLTQQPAPHDTHPVNGTQFDSNNNSSSNNNNSIHNNIANETKATTVGATTTAATAAATTAKSEADTPSSPTTTTTTNNNNNNNDNKDDNNNNNNNNDDDNNNNNNNNNDDDDNNNNNNNKDDDNDKKDTMGTVDENSDKMSDPKWLVQLVQQDTGQWRQYACGALQNMAVADENRIDLVHKYGALRPLLNVIADPEADDKSRELACGAVWAFATAPENRIAIKEAGGIPILWKVVEVSGERAGESSCGALQNLAIEDVLSVHMATECELVPKIVALLATKTSSKKQENKRTNALGVLWSLSVSPQNKMSLISVSGVVDVLVSVMRESNEDKHRELACGTVQNLAVYEENKQPLVQAPWLVDTLINLIKLEIMNGGQGSTKTSQFACGALHQLAKVINVLAFDILGACETVLTSSVPTIKSKEYAIGILFGVAFTEENRKPMFKSGSLMKLMCKMMRGQDQPTEALEKFREYSCGAMWGLAISEDLRFLLVEKFDVLSAATVALESSNPKAVENSCCLVQNLMISEAVKPVLKGNSSLVSAFITALSQPWANERIRDLGCGALQTLLALTEVNRDMALKVAPVVVVPARTNNSKAQTRACGVLWTLCQVKDVKHDLVSQFDVLSILAETLLSDDSKTRKFSSAALLHLSDDKDNRVAMANDPKLIKAMVKVVTLDTSKLREHCCGALCGLCFEESVRPTVGLNHKELIPAIVHAANSSSGQTQIYACGAIWGLSFAKENIESLIRHQVLHALEKGAKTDISGKLCEYSCATLQNVSVVESFRSELAFLASTLLEIITKILPTYDPAASKASKSSRILESCCAVIHNISMVEAKREALVREHGALKPMVAAAAIFEGKLRDLVCSTLRNLSQEPNVRQDFMAESLDLVKTLMKFLESDDPSQKRCRKLVFGTLKNLPLDDTSLNLLAMHSSNLLTDRRHSDAASSMDVTPRTVNSLIGGGSDYTMDSDMDDTRSEISNTPRTARGSPEDLDAPIEEPNTPKTKRSRKLSLMPWKKPKDEDGIPDVIDTDNTLAVPMRSGRRASAKK